MKSTAALLQESFSWPEVPLKYDITASADGQPEINLSQLLHFIFGDRLTLYPRKRGSARPLQSEVRPGWVHIGLDKRDLVNQEHTKFVRTYETMLDYVRQGYEYMTFGTFRVQKRMAFERNRRNMNSCHAFVLDIDSKTWSVDEILSFCSGAGLVPPSFINETPRGYHVWFVLDQDMVGPHECLKLGQRTFTKAGQYYVDINRFLIELFEQAFPSVKGAGDNNTVGVDNTIGGERYIRIPTNVCYFSGNKYSINHFAQMKRDINKARPKSKKTSPSMPASKMYIPHAALKKDPAYVKLLTMQPAVGERRYTAYTIALLFYSCNIDQEKTKTFLEAWFDRLQDKTGFAWKEVHNAIVSAYSGVKRGAHSKWIYRLTGLKPKIFFTRRVAEEDRIYKTMVHWERLFINQLRTRDGRWTVSSRELCLSLSMKSRSMLTKLIELLERKGVIQKMVEGCGRSAATTYILIGPDPLQERDSNKGKVISIDEYRKNMVTDKSLVNGPLSYRNLSRSTREGGRGIYCSPNLQSSDDDPGG